MDSLGEIIREKREEKGLLLRHVGSILDVDQALISKFERGERTPTKDQVVKLAKLYHMDVNELVAVWLSDKILMELKDEASALRAVKLVEKKIKNAH